MSGPFGAGALNFFSGAAEFYPYTIDQSARFNDDDSANLTRNFASDGTRTTYTFSCWLKRASINTGQEVFVSGLISGTFYYTRLEISTSNKMSFLVYNDANQGWMHSANLLRDVGAWYHLVWVFDTTNATASDRMRMYINGERVTSFATETFSTTYPSLNGVSSIMNSSYTHKIGRTEDGQGSGNFLDGYLADVNFIDGQALDPTSFGETKAGIWIPKDYTGSYGTNGFKLAFQDSASLGDDTSGNGHDFTSSGLASTDQMPDSPTNNRITFNGLSKDLRYSTALSDGNKTINFTAGNNGFSCCPSTIFRSEGQAYIEFELDTAGSGSASDNQAVCVFEADADIKTIGGGGNSKLAAAYNGGSSSTSAVIYDDGVSQGNPTKFTTAGQRIGVYIDYDSGKGWFSHEGTVQTVNGTPDVSAGTNPHFTFTANTLLTVGAGGIHSSGTPAKITMHDHPDDWETTPPSAYTAFAAVELPAPGIDPAADEAPTDYFNTVLYTGNETARSITGLDFQPSLTWIKSRSFARSSRLFDEVRGATKGLVSNSTNAELTQANELTSFDSGGFSLGNDYDTNATGQTYVAWNWKAGGTAVSNTDGSITSSVSASPESGFSIVTYTGNATAGATVGHGLGAVPTMIILKKRSSTQGWPVYHVAYGATQYTTLHSTDPAQSSSNNFNNTEPTSSVFTLGDGSTLNGSGATFVAYCFADIDGMVKAGSFIGNGSSDGGPMVFTGFRPAWIMIKAIGSTGGASNWRVVDSVRNTFNPEDKHLQPNTSGAEDTGSGAGYIDFLSNGFKIRTTALQLNSSGVQFIYLAFAEQPFKYANAR